MGCSASRLDDEEAVQLCKDRRDFIRQAVEERKRFASGHIAYIQSLRRVSAALRSYVDADEVSDPFITPPFAPVKRLTPEVVSIPLISPNPAPEQHDRSGSTGTYRISRYVGPTGNSNSSVYAEERPQTVRVQYGSGVSSNSAHDQDASSSSSTTYSNSKYSRPTGDSAEAAGTVTADSYRNPGHFGTGENSSRYVEEWPQAVGSYTSSEQYGFGVSSNSDPDHNASSSSTTYRISKYLRPNGNSAVYVEEWPQSAETVRVESYYSSENHGLDAFLAPQAPENSYLSSPYDRANYPPTASPQNSQWDAFWNPFSSLDAFGFHYRNTYDRMPISDDDTARLRQVREEEGIPELEDELTEQEPDDDNNGMDDKEAEEHVEAERVHERTRPRREDVTNEKCRPSTTCEAREFQTKGTETIEVSEARNVVEVEVTTEKEVLVKTENNEETPGFTVYLDRRPTSMSEVIKVIEDEFSRICECAQEVSAMLEASRAQYAVTTSTELAVKMLNPVTLFRSASSRSMSSRFFNDSSSFRGCDGYESSSDCSEESCMVSGSHQSTLDRLYTWEKKLYKEVKAGERVRLAFEKRCMQLKSQDTRGEEVSSVSKTRAALQDLDTRLRISLHTVESVSRRIETLCDDELQPQLVELIQGLERMWRTMAECHRSQKRATDTAKLLIYASTVSGKPSETAAPPRQLRSATALETELRNWRTCLESWVGAQRSYARALAGWILRCCATPDGGGARSPLSPRRSSSASGAPTMLGLCVQWSRLLESVGEAQVMDGLDFFAAGMGTVSAAAAARPDEEGPEVVVPMVTAEMAGKVLCAGMSAVASSAAEFAGRSAEGYEALLVKVGATVTGT